MEMKATKDDSAWIIEVCLDLDSQHFEFAFGQHPTVDNRLTEDIHKGEKPRPLEIVRPPELRERS